VAAIAPETDVLAELDEQTRVAWNAYSESVRDMTGEDYERIERESWAELQTELGRLERRRKALS
jgi:hypothetical protein